MNIDDFFDHAKDNGLTIQTLPPSYETEHLLDNEALFQLPLISLIILLMAKDRRKPKIPELGQLVGESLEQSIPGFKGSAQHVGWSANLRVRTIKAMTFLENSGLVEIANRKSKLEITKLGKKVIDKALSLDDNLSYNLSKIQMAYRNILVSKQFKLELI